ncbi:hypothetical protein [Spirosoma linguale]|uniref:Uncharacterized protein n=1 Tax=Spirosoma linguale (strain ATCC 33905 / DSM 74 / LMG 10896 / Claus 1) TaxID=504472 RepID=D2QEP8_SPILD|nr:hypothetical protein Slin_2279 [Spirosoma linguale DSM 74]
MIRITKFNDSVYLTEITEGTIDFVQDYLKILVSDNDLFKGVGNSTGLIRIPSTRLVERDYNTLDIAIANSEGIEDVKFDYLRQNLLDSLFKNSIQFLIAHEYFHVYNGHVDYIYYLRNIKEYNEGIGDSKLSPLDNQTLEMDADSSATCFLYDLLCNNFNSKYNEVKLIGKIPLSTPPLEGTEKQKIIYYVLFVAYFILKFTSLKRISTIDDLKRSSHPSQGMRMQFIAGALHAKVALEDKNLEEFVIMCSLRVMKDDVPPEKRSSVK